MVWYVALVWGGILVLLARRVAHWTDRQPWLVRIVGLIFLLLGTGSVFYAFGAVAGLKMLLGVAVGAGLYIWQDARAEQADLRKEQAERDRLFARRGEDDPPL